MSESQRQPIEVVYAATLQAARNRSDAYENLSETSSSDWPEAERARARADIAQDRYDQQEARLLAFGKPGEEALDRMFRTEAISSQDRLQFAIEASERQDVRALNLHEAREAARQGLSRSTTDATERQNATAESTAGRAASA